jgi:flagellar hook-length control protein FliK
MPSTATTNLTISTILDLIGPLAQPQIQGKDPSAFDALLQPPAPPHLPAPPAREPTTHESSRSHSDNSRPVTSTDESQSASEHSPPGDQAEDCLPASGSTVADESDSPAADEDDGQRSEPVPDAATPSDTLISQSLAGIVAAPALATEVIPAGAALLTDQPAVAEQDPSEPAGKSSSNLQRSAVAPVVATAAAESVLPVESSLGSDPASNLADDEQGQAAAKDPLAAKNTAGDDSPLGPVAIAEGNNHSGSTTDEHSAPEQRSDAELEILETNSLSEGQPKGSRQIDQRQADSPTGAATVPSADVAASTPTPSPPNSPVVGVVTASAPITDATSTFNNSGNSPAIAPGGQTQRSRLPAELFAQPAGATQHRGPIEIDTTRLLSRVARAFAAAQERDGEVRLRLSPPELGALRLDIRIQDGALVANLQTETDAARVAILENLPALRERLAEQGVRIERFDVDLMQRQSNGTSSGMPNQSDGRQHDAPPAALRVVPPPRRTVEPAPSSSALSASAVATDGLNVII